MDVAIEKRQNAVIVRMAGEGRLETAGDLKSTLEPVLAQNPERVVFDLGDVTFASSLFMGTLIQFRNQARRDGCRVSMCGLQESVAKAFEVARLEWIIPTFSSIDEALGDTT